MIGEKRVVQTNYPPQAILTKASEEITEEMFDDAMAGLPTAIIAWRRAIRRHLLSQLPGKDTPESDLLLATSVFASQNHGALHFPSVPHHQSLTGKGVSRPSTADAPIVWETDIEIPSVFIQYNARGALVAGFLAQACGLDPKTAAVSDLDSADGRFACLFCSDVSQKRCRAMTWRRAVSRPISVPHPLIANNLFF